MENINSGLKVKDLNIKAGTKIKLYINRAKDGSGGMMGRGIAGNKEYLTEVIWDGPIYDGTMGQAKYLDGSYIGLPISVSDILMANEWDKI